MHLCPLCGSTMGIDPTTVALATYGIDWEDDGPNCPPDNYVDCFFPRMFLPSENCRADSMSNWFFAEVSCNEFAPHRCNCSRCCFFWNSETCTDPEQAPLFTSGEL